MTSTHRRWSVHLGSVAGIKVRVHASFLVLVAVVAAIAASTEGPGVASAVLWLVPLFASVLVHELAHSIVARRYGIAVRDIQLLPIGGVSRLARVPDDPAVTLRIALAGPMASIGVAISCAVAATASGSSVWPPTLYAGDVLVRLSWVNLVLAAFNLLPALPLDGGRVYRAFLERRVGRIDAMRTAAKVARDLAVVLALVGILVSPLLLVLGVIVYAGSQAESAAADVYEALDGLTIADALRTSGDGLTLEDLPEDQAVVSPDTPLVAAGLIEGEVEAVAVADEGRLVGFVDRGDVERLAARHLGRLTTHPPPPPPPA